MADTLPLAALTLYAELTSELVAIRRQHRGELPPGTFVKKLAWADLEHRGKGWVQPVLRAAQRLPVAIRESLVVEVPAFA